MPGVGPSGARQDAPRYWLRGLFWGLLTLGLAFGLRMMEWPC